MNIIIGILVAVLVFLIFGPSIGEFKKSKLSSALEEISSVEETEKLSKMDPKSLQYKLAASGINWSPATFRSINILGAIGGMLLIWAFIPGIPAVAAGALVYYVPNAWLDDKIKNRGREIDKLLPLAMSRISAGISAGRSVADTLDNVADSLDLEGKNPLSPELQLTAAELRTKNREEAMMNLARRSPSSSLSNMAYLLEGFLEEGGTKYSEIFSQSIERVELVLNARNRTRAKAGDAMSSAKIIPILLVIVMAYLGQNPSTKATMTALPVQIVLGLTIVVMAAGYVIMRSLVMEAA
jgi:Flp pilus assembly protein TadB